MNARKLSSEVWTKPRTDSPPLNIRLRVGKARRAHPYWYARVIGIFHCLVRHRGLDGSDGDFQRVEFLWVRWYTDPVNECGWAKKRLPRLRFVQHDKPDAFGFVNPADVIRGIHIIPAFYYGRTSLILPNPSLARACGRDAEVEEDDWEFAYVNMFVDRDMVMRFRGGGIGHRSTKSCNTILRRDVLDPGALQEEQDIEINEEHDENTQEANDEDEEDDEEEGGRGEEDEETEDEDEEEDEEDDKEDEESDEDDEDESDEDDEEGKEAEAEDSQAEGSDDEGEDSDANEDDEQGETLDLSGGREPAKNDEDSDAPPVEGDGGSEDGFEADDLRILAAAGFSSL